MNGMHEIRTYFKVCYGSEPSGLLQALTEGLGGKWLKGPHDYYTKVNSDYDVDVNNMIRVTLAPFFGKESAIKKIARDFGVSFMLEIVPELYAGSEYPTPILSLERDIIEFLYLSGADYDLDLYIF